MSDALQHLVDENAIRRLIEVYARAADTRDGDLFASVFVPEGVLELGENRTEGHRRLAKIPEVLNRYAKSYHTIFQSVIDIDGDTATGETYSASHHLNLAAGVTYSDKLRYITYRDRFVRTDDGWRIEHRLVVQEFSSYEIVQDVG